MNGSLRASPVNIVNSAEMLGVTKSFLLLAAVAICEVNCAKITMEQMEKASEPIRMVCIQKSKVSEDALMNMRAGILGDQKELKCYVNCVLEMMQMVREKRVCQAICSVYS